MRKMKISFDWDSTLAEDRQQRIAEKFIAEGHEVYITTSRCADGGRHYSNDIIFIVAERLGIPKERVRFSGGGDNNGNKWGYLHDFDMHFDDDQIEIELIEENTKCIGILIYDP